MNAESSVSLFGLHLCNVSLAQAADGIVQRAQMHRRAEVFFVNAHCVNVAAANPGYASSLHNADMLLADGSGMRLAARLAGTPLVDNVNGTDLFPQLCARAARARLPIALLGGRPGVAKRCAEAMAARFPGLEVAWAHHGFAAPEGTDRLIDALNASSAELVFVAMGVPRQELWIERHRSQLRAPVLLAVGALFDFYSGDIPRAPLWLRRLGLEWCFRLMQEPRRLFGRYVVGNPLFLARLLWLRSRGASHLASAGIASPAAGTTEPRC